MTKGMEKKREQVVSMAVQLQTTELLTMKINAFF
jgi:hypothetical protein